jgi:DNA-binding response OmpR family regulator/HPt (histidine-containing phosphotransfer) domain-containing protein
MNDLQAQYVAGLVPQISALQAALESGPECDVGEVSRIAHQLKGSGASFGFPEVSTRAAAVLRAEERDIEAAGLRLLETLHSVASSDAASLLLIIDDDPAIRLLLRACLDGRFDSTEEAASIAEARALLEGGCSPTLILLDLVLGDGDGRELLAEIRSRTDLSAVPVAVMSAHRRQEVQDECTRLGADGFIQKPFQPDDLVPVVDDLVRSGRRMAEPEPEPPAADTTADRPRSSTRILLAEDDPLTADLVTDRLQRRGYTVIHCANGQDALEAARHRSLALAVIDVTMPKMNGFELLGKLREMRRHATTPVVMLTGMSDERSVIRAFELGANDYVMKPFSPTELTARVVRLIGD